jgi:NAD(P)-dependent dehydrogenase (short-subunit alcohol dehydrogenase family)
VLPTSRAARYTGGLWVAKFLKTCTYQHLAELQVRAVDERSLAPGRAGRARDRRRPRQWLDDPAFRAEVLERRLPTGELGQIEDVAHAVRYLACDASHSVTGHILKVDGGWTAW